MFLLQLLLPSCNIDDMEARAIKSEDDDDDQPQQLSNLSSQHGTCSIELYLVLFTLCVLSCLRYSSFATCNFYFHARNPFFTTGCRCPAFFYATRDARDHIHVVYSDVHMNHPVGRENKRNIGLSRQLRMFAANEFALDWSVADVKAELLNRPPFRLDVRSSLFVCWVALNIVCMILLVCYHFGAPLENTF